MGFVVRAVAVAFALWVATALVGGIHVDGNWVTYLLVAVVFGLVNSTVGTMVRTFSFPFVILTLGLVLLIINGAMLALTALLLDSFRIDNFTSAVLGSLIISLVSAPAAMLLKNVVKR